MQKISYTDLIKQYPAAQYNMSEQTWIEVFNETIDEEFFIFGMDVMPEQMTLDNAPFYIEG